MNIDHAELQMELATVWAQDFEAIEQKAKDDSAEHVGGARSIEKVKNTLNGNRKYYQDKFDANEITGDECKFAMKVISQQIVSLDLEAEQQKLKAQHFKGIAAGAGRCAEILAKNHEKVKGKLVGILDAIDKGDIALEDAGKPKLVGNVRADVEKRKAEAKAAAEPQSKVTKKKASKKKATKKKASKKASK